MAPDYESVLAAECREANIALDDVAYWWYKSQRASLFIKRRDVPDYNQIRDEMVAEMRKYAPKYKKLIAKPPGDSLQVLPLADLHFGKLSDVHETGWDYCLSETDKVAREGVAGLMGKAAGFKPNVFVLVIGNDILHTDNAKHTSTAGTPQDTSGSIYMMHRFAKRFLIATIEQLANHGDVHVIHAPSNHDWVSGTLLADSIGSWFHNHPRVHLGGEFHQSLYPLHRKYLVYGQNLLMFTHGDGAKEGDLPWLMADEAKEAWGQTTFRYVYAGHVHHKVKKAIGQHRALLEKDRIGVTEIHANMPSNPRRQVFIEYVRSPSPADGWHHRNGYVNLPAMETFLHSPTEGQFARFTHSFV